MDSLGLVYIAGFFDGEGSVTIHENGGPSPRGKNTNHTLQVSIGNTDPRILRLLYTEFGGSLTLRQNTKPNHRDVYQWIIRAAKALPFLEAIEPFVEMKREQVIIALAFQRSKKLGNKPVSVEVLQWREEQRQTIRNLNSEQK